MYQKVDQRSGQLSLLHIGITKAEISVVDMWPICV